MNTIISIRLFIIFVENKVINKQVRKIVDFEMVFCQNHNLLMYLKTTMITLKILKIVVKKVEKSFESKSSNSDDNLFDIEKIVRESNF